MQRKALFLLAFVILAFIIASLLLIFVIDYSGYCLVKELCTSAIVASVIAIPNVVNTLIFDRKQIRRSRMKLVQSLNVELKSLQKMISDEKHIKENRHRLMRCTLNMEVFVANLMVELTDNHMNNERFNFLLNKTEACIRKLYVLNRHLDSRYIRRKTVKVCIEQVKSSWNDCMNAIQELPN